MYDLLGISIPINFANISYLNFSYKEFNNNIVILCGEILLKTSMIAVHTSCRVHSMYIQYQRCAMFSKFYVHYAKVGTCTLTMIVCQYVAHKYSCLPSCPTCSVRREWRFEIYNQKFHTDNVKPQYGISGYKSRTSMWHDGRWLYSQASQIIVENSGHILSNNQSLA